MAVAVIYTEICCPWRRWSFAHLTFASGEMAGEFG